MLLTGILGMINLMQTTSLTPEQQEYAESVEASSAHLLGVVSQILDFSCIQSGHLEVVSHPYDLRMCVEECLEIVYSPIKHGGIELLYDMDTRLPSVVFGDEQRIRQILLNLLSNALKFTVPMGTGEVMLSVQLAEGTAALRDYGWIPQQTQEGFFRRRRSGSRIKHFFDQSQVDSNTDTHHPSDIVVSVESHTVVVHPQEEVDNSAPDPATSAQSTQAHHALLPSVAESKCRGDESNSSMELFVLFSCRDTGIGTISAEMDDTIGCAFCDILICSLVSAP
jgi:signal transduction histidine kinase